MYPHDMCSVLAYHVPARYVFCSPSRERGLLSVSPCIAYTLLQEIPPREIASQEIASRLHLPRPSQVLCSPVGPLPCLPISLTGGELRALLTARSAPSVPPPVPPRATVAAASRKAHRRTPQAGATLRPHPRQSRTQSLCASSTQWEWWAVRRIFHVQGT